MSPEAPRGFEGLRVFNSQALRGVSERIRHSKDGRFFEPVYNKGGSYYAEVYRDTLKWSHNWVGRIVVIGFPLEPIYDSERLQQELQEIIGIQRVRSIYSHFDSDRVNFGFGETFYRSNKGLGFGNINFDIEIGARHSLKVSAYVQKENDLVRRFGVWTRRERIDNRPMVDMARVEINYYPSEEISRRAHSAYASVGSPTGVDSELRLVTTPDERELLRLSKGE